LEGSASAGVPAVTNAAIRISDQRTTFSITSMRLRETSFPPAFAKWLKALKEMLPASN
jgi:hypothetical protein